MPILLPSTEAPPDLLYKSSRPEGSVEEIIHNSRSIRNALLYNGEFMDARKQQALGNVDYVRQQATPSNDKWKQALASTIAAGDAGKYQNLAFYLEALQRNGHRNVAEVQEKYSKLNFDEAELLENGFKSVLAERLEHYYGKAGIGNVGWNILKGMVGWDGTSDYMQAAGSGWFDMVGKNSQRIQEFLALPVHERVERLAEFEEKALADFDGNNLDIANYLSLLAMTPSEVEERVRQQQTFDFLVATDIGAVVTGIGFGLVTRARNAAKVAADLQNMDEAGALLERAVKAGDASALGMTTDELAASMSVIKTSDIFPGSIDGLRAGIKQRLDGRFDKLSRIFTSAKLWLNNADNAEFMAREGVNELNFNTLWNRQLQKIEELKAQHLKEYGTELEVRTMRVTDKGLEVVWKESGEKVGTTRQPLLLEKTDEGMLSVTEASALDLMKSPTFALDQQIVSEGQRLVNTRARVANVLNAALQEVYKPLKKNPFAKRRVEALLAQADLEGRAPYTIDELRAGVEIPTQNGSKLVALKSDGEIEAYYTARRFQDELKYLNNFVVYERKEAQGIMTITLEGSDNVLINMYDEFGEGVGESYATKEGAEDTLRRFYGRELTDEERGYVVELGEDQFGIKLPGEQVSRLAEAKPYGTESQFRSSLSRSNPDIIKNPVYFYNGETGKIERMTEELLSNTYQKSNWIFARFGEHKWMGDRSVRFARVRVSGVKPLNPIQLDFSPSYVPRIKRGVEYAVYKEAKDGGFKRLNRYFNTRLEAEKYASRRNRTGSKFFYKPAALRDVTGRELEEHVVEQYGGAFIGKRGKPVMVGEGHGTPPELYKPFQAITMNLDYLAHNLNINAWRMSVEKRWFNTVDAIAKAKNMKREELLESPTDFYSTIKLPLTDPARLALEEHRNYIKDILKIPQESSRIWNSSLRHGAEMLEKFIVGKYKVPGLGSAADTLRRGILNFSNIDPAALVRTSTFHPMLGMLQPSQFFVQAFGASIALTMHPLSAPKRMWEMMALATVRFMDHTSPGFPEAVKRAAKAAGLNPDEFLGLVTTFRKTGLTDAILQNADYNAAIKGYGMTRGVFMRLLNTGTVFYQAGERVAIEYTFLQAFANWRKLNPTAPLNDAATKAILVETKRIGMDMSIANRAFYQKGVLSIPTQFTKVFWEYLGNLLGKKWTPYEKLKVVLGQGLLFGAASVQTFTPESLLNGIEQLAGGKHSITEERKSLIREGVFGWIADLAGVNVDVAYRLAIAGQDNIVTELLAAAFTSKTLDVDNMGPWVTVMGRYGQALKKSLGILRQPMLHMQNPHLVVDALHQWAKVSSTATGIEKMRTLYYTGQYVSASGTKIAQNEEWKNDTILSMMTAMGFVPSEVSRAFRDSQFIMRNDENKRNAMKEVSRQLSSYATRFETMDEGTPEYNELIQERDVSLTAAMIRYGYVTEAQQAELWGSVLRRLSNPETLEEKNLMRRIKKMQTGEWVVGTPEPVVMEDE